MNNHLFRALSVKSFLFLWLAEVFSQVASNMMNFILILIAFSLTNSSTAVSGIVLSFTIPAILFGLLAGVFVDRWDKKTVLLITNFIRAALVFMLAFTHRNLFALYSYSFLITTATQFFIPAETPIIPLIVEKELLFSANALFGIALYGSILVAYGLSGPFLLVFGRRSALIILSIFFLIASIAVIFLKYKSKAAAKKSKTIITLTGEIREALSIIFKTKDIYHSFLLLMMLQVLILIISVIGPGYAKNILGIKINEFPILFVTPAAIGMVTGALFLTTYFNKHSKQKSATLGLFISAISILLLPFGSKVASRSFVLALNTFLPKLLKVTILHMMVVLAFILGFAMSLIFVPANTIIQEKTSDEVRGKIYGALNTLVALVSLIPIIIAGSLADIFGVQTVLVGVAIALSIIASIRVADHVRQGRISI